MKRTQLPIEALPAWCKLNDVTFLDTAVMDLEGKGLGLVLERGLSSKDTFDTPTLLLIPHDLILSAEAIEEHAKVDHHFRQLLDIAGGKSFRGDIMLFLLMQITISSSDHGQSVGLSNPWSEYVKMLPSTVPVPTMWTDEERVMLMGTSLESALNAKMTALRREFDSLQESTSNLSWCQKSWWESGSVEFSDWLLIDSWYRSRCLELPIAGPSMVPALDMANHSLEPAAYYEETRNNSVALLLRPNVELKSGDEITISYDDGGSKSAAEMLFSYGFLDEQSSAKDVVLTLEPFADDPLGKAKFVAFEGPPVVRITQVEGDIKWESPFLYLLCLNEEDGLDFKVLQETDGSRSHLKMFWQGSDVTAESTMFETLISQHELRDVFSLRTVALLQDRIQGQLERLYECDDTLHSLASMSLTAPDRQNVALKLRSMERGILEAAFASVDQQKTELLENENVLRYLGDPDDAQQKHSEPEESNEEEDFS